MAEQSTKPFLGIAWVNVKGYQGLRRGVMGIVSVALDSSVGVLVDWASLPKEELFPELQVLVDVEQKVRIFMGGPYRPPLFVEEELPRPSDDPAPWDQEWFYEED